MPAVVQTQIILSVVGAIIMLVVGASLARAFGIVGAANLIRYRSKIDDPKDAVVMLGALAVGLASGVGLYALATFSTAFLMLALGIIESFEKGVKKFDLTIKDGEKTDDLRDSVERIFNRFKLEYRAARVGGEPSSPTRSRCRSTSSATWSPMPSFDSIPRARRRSTGREKEQGEIAT